MSPRQALGTLPRSVLYATLAVALLLVGGVTFSLTAGTPGADAAGDSGTRTSPREIVLEARGMAFYLPGDATPNPTLILARGERVRLTLANRDPGMAHDLAARSLAVATPVLEGGAAASVVLRAPESSGVHEYVCTLHPILMRGLIEVR